MDPKLFATVFASVFLAELGDKTQLATFLFAANAKNSRLLVFLAAASALILTSAIGVLLGTVVARYVSERVLSWVAGAGFVVIGIWTIVRA